MKSQISKLLALAEGLRDRAEEYSNSESEKTADKYSPVWDSLSAACDSLQEAIDELE